MMATAEYLKVPPQILGSQPASKGAGPIGETIEQALHRYGFNGTAAPVQLPLGTVASSGQLSPTSFAAGQYPFQTSSAQKALARLRKFMNWDSNWDGEGAPKPNADHLEAASLLVGFLSAYGLKQSCVLDALGQPMILVSSDKGSGEITIDTSGNLEFAIQAGHDDSDIGIPFDRQTIPNRLALALQDTGIV